MYQFKAVTVCVLAGFVLTVASGGDLRARAPDQATEKGTAGLRANHEVSEISSTPRSAHAGVPQIIPPGTDYLETTGIAYVEIGGSSGIPPIPQDFFWPGSDPWQGVIEFRGDPIPGACGAVDTMVERTDPAIMPGPTTVRVELIELDLVSVRPIVITGEAPAPGEKAAKKKKAIKKVKATKNPYEISEGLMVIEETVVPPRGKAGMPSDGTYSLNAAEGGGMSVYLTLQFFDVFPESKAGAAQPITWDLPVPILIETMHPQPWQYADPPLACESGNEFYEVPEVNIPTMLDGGDTGTHIVIPPRPTEACCTLYGECMDLDPVDCMTYGGMPMGPGSYCMGDSDLNGVDDACEGMTVTIPPGYDYFETKAGTSWQQFGGDSEIPPIPADFFFPGSLPWEGTIELRAQPIPGYCGAVDTVVERLEEADLAGGSDTIQVELKELSLMSVEPIGVRGPSGEVESFFDVFTELSSTTPSTGQMTIYGTHAEGGYAVMSATGGGGISVYPRFSFFEVWPSSTAKGVVDPIVWEPPDPLLLETYAPMPWQYEEPPISCVADNGYYPVPDEVMYFVLDEGRTGEHGVVGPRVPDGCCLMDGTCIDIDPEDCVILGGVPQGQPCTGQSIACCLQPGDDPDCMTVELICCDDQGGMPSPSGEPICLGDSNGNGRDDACEPPCEPTPDGLGCTDVICPDPIAEECVPVRVRSSASGPFFPIGGIDVLEGTTGEIVVEDPGGLIESYEILPDAMANITRVQRGDPEPVGGDHIVATEIIEMELVAGSVAGGGMYIHLADTLPSTGQIVDTNEDPGSDYPADSFFDVYVTVDLIDLPGATGLSHLDPIPLEKRGLTQLPPWGEPFETPADWAGVELLDATGLPTGYWIRRVVHVPPPPPPPWAVIDCECLPVNACHVMVDPLSDPKVWCEGACPIGEICQLVGTDTNADGLEDEFECQCGPPPVGVCCLPVGACLITTEAECLAMGGVYGGDGSQCGDVEACCQMMDGTCIDTIPICCDIYYYGIAQGTGTGCSFIEVACCLPNGDCVQTDPLCCDEMGGTLSPTGSEVCLGDGNNDGRDDACEQPQACCMPAGNCRDLSHTDCVLLGGDPQGPGTLCDIGIVVCNPLKWSQPPVHDPAVPNPECFWGWDEFSVYDEFPLPPWWIVADDWACEANTPVKDVHWWGSYIGWSEQEPPAGPDRFHIAIWSDVPAGVDQLFSHPGTVIWEARVDRGALRERPVGCDCYQGMPCDTCFRYDFEIPEAEWFDQGPACGIYWISISAVYELSTPQHYWGWKTRPHFFSDDAVRVWVPTAPHVGEEFQVGAPIEDPPGTSWDMAFVLTTVDCQIASQPAHDPIPVPVDIGFGTKNRYMSFMGGDPGRSQAARVTFMSLPDFPYANGRMAWVQAPYLVTEASGSNDPVPPPTMWAARLGCEPYYTDWSVYGTVHVFDAGIVPGSRYQLQLLDSTCDCTDPLDYGPPLIIDTSAIGDVVGDCGVQPCTAPQGVIDFVDISSVVEKFKNTPGSPRKARADIISSDINQPVPDQKIDFVDVSYCVDAFRNQAALPPGPPQVDPCPDPCPPAVGRVEDGGCLPGSDGPPADSYEPCPEDDSIELSAGPGMLYVLHQNATYNCCFDQIAISLDLQGNLLRLDEEEVPPGGYCDCICCYDINAVVVNLDPGEYLVQYCWLDYELGPRCHEETIIIPGAPRVEGVSDSGCLADTEGDPVFSYEPCPDDDTIELTPGPGTLYVSHENATYNCCPDEFAVSVHLEGSLLQMNEIEILTNPCYCICCYDIQAIVVNLDPGEYTVQYCWSDYELGPRCHEETIVIPGAGPYVGEHSNTGCLPGTKTVGTKWDDMCGVDLIDIDVGSRTLYTSHQNLEYNCCIEPIAYHLTVEDNVLTLTEEEILEGGGCDCNCCYETNAAVVNLEPGEYTLHYCWYEYWEGMTCRTFENVVIPGDEPYVGDQTIGECYTGEPPKSDDYPWCGDDAFEFTPGTGTLHTAHLHATYNCCPDDIPVSARLEGSILRLREEEILTMPCPCLCCYDIEATVLNLEPGMYTVEYCWADYETGQEECYVEDVVIP